jgi:BlaI family transcriptional regulator, penicillinase repressor
MERLTPAEEKVMLKLWQLNKGVIHEIVALYDEPKPAYNTISTIVRILERKKFIKHKPHGRGYTYLPKISKEEYRDYLSDYLLKNYYDGSLEGVLSFYSGKK